MVSHDWILEYEARTYPVLETTLRCESMYAESQET
jgi:hypothetical protein